MITTDQPLVSIIIVNTHEEKFLIPLIESVEHIETGLNYEIIIVDNDSHGYFKSFDKKDFHISNIISLNENAGFCRANNAGLRMANGKYVLLLNPDTLLQQPSIFQCINYFENHQEEKIGAIGCRLQNTDGSFQKSFFGLAASMKKTIQANAVYIKLFGNRIKRQSELLDEELHQRNSNPPWLCGAFVLMNHETFLKEKFFLDEDFFLYSDDVELGYRIRARGYQLLYFHDVSIIHFGGNSRPFFKWFEQLTISEWLCMMKIHSKFYFFINQSFLLVNIVLDNLFFKWAAIRNKITITDKREKIIRKKIWSLWRQFTFRILMDYKKTPSSSQTMLRFPLLKK